MQGGSALNFSYHKKLGQKRAALGLRPVAAALIHLLCRWWDPLGGRKRAARLASKLPPRSHRNQVQPLRHCRKPCFRKMAAVELTMLSQEIFDLCFAVKRTSFERSRPRVVTQCVVTPILQLMLMGQPAMALMEHQPHGASVKYTGT